MVMRFTGRDDSGRTYGVYMVAMRDQPEAIWQLDDGRALNRIGDTAKFTPVDEPERVITAEGL